MRAIVAYDVSTPDAAGQKRLRKVAKLMERYGLRVQKSVFECLVNDTKLEKLLGEVEGIIRMTQDSVIVYLIGDCCVHRTLRIGVAPPDRLNPEGFVL